MRYVVTYDVPSDRVRARIAKLLEGYGRRVQYSVFECDLSDAHLAKLMERLPRTLGASGAGTILIYRVCRDCIGASRIIGDVEAHPTGPCFIVD